MNIFRNEYDTIDRNLNSKFYVVSYFQEIRTSWLWKILGFHMVLMDLPAHFHFLIFLLEQELPSDVTVVIGWSLMWHIKYFAEFFFGSDPDSNLLDNPRRLTGNNSDNPVWQTLTEWCYFFFFGYIAGATAGHR